jgi:membrane associated rhomboid family serine protease
MRVLGASGAVCSFVTLGILLNPTSTVLIWFVIPVPAAVFGVGYVTKEFWMQYFYAGSSGEAHVGHLAGSAIGLAAWGLVRNKRGMRF